MSDTKTFVPTDESPLDATLSLEPQRRTIGTAEFGDFRMVREIGRGGMGVVYEAEQVSLRRRVALKVLHGAADGGEVRQRFQREAETVGGLHHTNIVPLHAVGFHGEFAYYAMQLISGQSIAAVLARENLSGGCLPPRDVARWTLQTAEAIAHAHQRGVIHRDIKPSNLLLDESGIVWLTDFGLARREDEVTLTASGALLGTPRYMSPEQASGQRDLDFRTDIYSLGATLYELLTGQPVFAGATAPAVIHQILHAEPRPPRKVRPGIPADLETICLKCLAKEPARRYATAQLLADDLRRFLAGEPILARPLGVFARTWRWVRRNKAQAAAIALTGVAGIALLLLAVGTSFTLRLREQQKITELARQEADEQRSLAEQFQHRAELLTAEVARDRGRVLCEQGDAAQGLNWLARGLKLLPAGEPEAERELRLLWSVWRPALHPLVHRFQLGGAVWSVAFSPDGQSFFCAGFDGSGQIRDTRTGEQRGKSLQHADKIMTAVYRPQGDLLLTASHDRTARLWNASTGEPHGPPLQHNDLVNAACFSPDGRLALTASTDSTARLWNTATGEPVGTALKHSVEVSAAAFSHDGKLAATGTLGGKVQLWDVATREPRGPLLSQGYMIRSLEFGRDDRTLASAASDSTAQIWDTETFQPRGPALQHTRIVFRLAYSLDGKTLATASWDKSVRIWSADTGKEIGHLQHGGALAALAFSPDGTLLATACLDGTVKLWDLALQEPVGTTLSHKEMAVAVAFSPDGKLLLTGSADGSVNCWEVAGRPSVRQLVHPHGVHAVALSPDGAHAAVGDAKGHITLWNVATGQTIGPPHKQHEGRVDRIVFTSDGQRLVSAAADGTARLLNTARGEPEGAPAKHSELINDLAISPDQRLVATAGDDGTARLWNLDGLTPALPPLACGARVLSVAFGPSSEVLVTGSSAGTGQLWDVQTGQPVGEPLRHSKAVRRVAFHPQGKIVATASEDLTARLWDATTGKPVSGPLPHQFDVHTAAFSPDGKWLLTGCSDNTGRLWDGTTGRAVGSPWGQRGVIDVVKFSPDSRLALIGSTGSRAQVWEVPAGRPFGPRLDHDNRVIAIDLNNRTVIFGGDAPVARLWTVPSPTTEDVDQLLERTERLTGLRLDEKGALLVPADPRRR